MKADFPKSLYNRLHREADILTPLIIEYLFQIQIKPPKSIEKTLR